ncbi:hypothetical protein M5J24_004432 [Salmonella enterica subsp. enterica]|nr:hypothetical protein [Salmonella enterica subsp. enterica]
MFDEVLGIRVPRTEHERRTKFNSDSYKPTPDEIKRFPSRPNQEQPEANRNMDLVSSMLQEHGKKITFLKLTPSNTKSSGK